MQLDSRMKHGGWIAEKGGPGKGRDVSGMKPGARPKRRGGTSAGEPAGQAGCPSIIRKRF